MNCRDIDALIGSLASGAQPSPEAAAHIAGCARCRLLVAAMRQNPEPAAPSAEQVVRIRGTLLADLKPVRPLPASGVWWFAFLCVLAAVVTAGVAHLGTAGWHTQAALQRTAVLTVLAAAAGLLTISLSRQAVPGARLSVSPYALVSAFWGILVAIFLTLFHPLPEATFVSTGLVCLKIGLECALPAGILCWLLLRRGAVLNPVPAGMVTGALAGLGGLVVLEIFCPNMNRYHKLVWHLGAAVISALAGAGVGTIVEHFESSRNPTRPQSR